MKRIFSVFGERDVEYNLRTLEARIEVSSMVYVEPQSHDWKASAVMHFAFI